MTRFALPSRVPTRPVVGTQLGVAYAGIRRPLPPGGRRMARWGQAHRDVREGRCLPDCSRPSASRPAAGCGGTDVNKFSNNVMAQHVFPTMALQKRRGHLGGGPVTSCANGGCSVLVPRASPSPTTAGLSGEAMHQRPGTGAHAAGGVAVARDAGTGGPLPVAGIDGTCGAVQARGESAHLKPAACAMCWRGRVCARRRWSPL